MTTAALTQASYRFYTDDAGGETANVAIAAQDTAITSTITSDTNVILRIRFQNTNAAAGAATDDFQLQRSIQRPSVLAGATPGWVNVTTSSNGVKGFNSTNLTDAGATTNRLGAGTGSFVAGKVSEDGLLDDLNITASNYTEFVYAITLVAADLGHEDIVTFRVLRNASIGSLTFTVTPQITVTKVSTGFGGLKGILRQTLGTSITNPASAVGAVTVALGDLVYAHLNEQTNPTAGACTDNLGNIYTAVGAETDAGATAARAYSSVVTVAGSLTQVDIVATASSLNFNATALVFEGPFTNPAQDVHPADGTTDLTSPLTWPATGTLSQADELIIASIAGGNWPISNSINVSTLSATTSPQQLISTAGDNASFQTSAFLAWVVSATTTQTPELTCATDNPASAVYITASFKKAATTIFFGGELTILNRGRPLVIGY